LISFSCHSCVGRNPLLLFVLPFYHFLIISRKALSMVTEKQYYIYILASRKNGTLYVGVTNNLLRRIYEHKNDLVEGFTKKYNVHKLVHYEKINDVRVVIQREKRIKKWKREWKINLIEKLNPEWKDLYYDLLSQANS